MTDRKQCTDCQLDYSDEAAHRLVHDAVTAAAAALPAGAATPQPQVA